MKKRNLALLLIVSALAVSCGGGTVPGETTADGGNVTTHEETTAKAEYEFADIDLGGDSFTVLNATTTWGFYSSMDFESQTGESLDDKVYERNRFVEEKYGMKLEIVEDDIDKNYEKYRSSILAGDDEFDVAYIRCDRIASFIADGYLCNLLDYPTFRLDENWWDQTVTQKSLIGDKKHLYFASNDFSLVGFDGTLCCYFNEDMLADLKLDKPYDLVREGKWTIDRLKEYTAAAANLNGDESFAWNENGNAIYGLASYEDCVNGFITGSGENYVTVDKNGQPKLLANAERFYNVIDKAFGIIGTDGEFLFKNGSGNSHYEMIFKNGRSLFTVAEIKASSKYRDMDMTFGIVPIPKYDEAQDKYYSHRTHVCLTMSMPKTNPEPERTGIIMDTFAYLSKRDILPEYYNVKVAQKGLRNEDSIEMLGIISEGRGFDIGEGYGWTEDLSSKVNTMLVSTRQNNVASLVDSYRAAIEADIQKTLDLMK